MQPEDNINSGPAANGAATSRDAAWAAHRAGLNVLPPREDGSKAPLGQWQHYETRRSTDDEISCWYGVHAGVGVVCGAVSGNLEVLDFDDRLTYLDFKERAAAVGLGDLVERIEAGYLEQSPSGGIHWLYQSGEISRNTKLARRPKTLGEMQHPKDNVKALIETRGNGGYVIVAPSNGRVHPSGKPYILLQGSFATIPTITPDERRELWELARTFDQMPPGHDAEAVKPPMATPGERPGDDFNARALWGEILRPHGWTVAYLRNGVVYLRRPGKTQGISATTNYQGSDLLFVFSTSTPFEPERGYNKFSAYTLLNYGGDFQAAAKALAAQGYGEPMPDGHQQGARGEEEWPPLGNLPQPSTPPSLTEEMVPGPLRPWLADVARHACLPLEMPTVPALVALGSVVGRRLGIRPNRFDDYTVVPNLWGDVIARSGAMKSYAVEEGLKPVKCLAATAHDRFQAEDSLARAHVLRLEAEIEAVKSAMKQSARGKKGTADIASLEADLAEKLAALEVERPKERRYWTQDATIEKLQELLVENPQGLLLARDELAGWLRAMDKPGREGDREFYLEAWNGTGSYYIDRIGRGTVYIPEVCLSVVGGIQPGKLRHYIDEAISEGGGADGMLQRLQVSVWVEHLGDWSPPDSWPDSQAKNIAYAIFQALDDMSPTDIGALQDDESSIPYLRFTPDSQALHDTWRTDLENRIRGDELEDAPAFESHISKYRSLMPSLALLFHLVDIATGTQSGPVPVGATRLAADWCEFLEAHAKRIYSAEIALGVDAAHRLAKRVKDCEVKDGATVKSVYEHHWGGLATPGEVYAALEVLASAAWVRIERLDTGGRPSDIIRLHPNLREKPDEQV